MLLGASALLAQNRPAPPTSDPRAIAVAGRVMEALGGETAWNNTHYLRFTFAVEREGKKVRLSFEGVLKGESKPPRASPGAAGRSTAR